LLDPLDQLDDEHDTLLLDVLMDEGDEMLVLWLDHDELDGLDWLDRLDWLVETLDNELVTLDQLDDEHDELEWLLHDTLLLDVLIDEGDEDEQDTLDQLELEKELCPSELLVLLDELVSDDQLDDEHDWLDRLDWLEDELDVLSEDGDEQLRLLDELDRLDQELELGLLDEELVDDELDELDEDDRSSIEYTRKKYGAWFVTGPGYCKSIVWKWNCCGTHVSPVASVSRRIACHT
jgi:hypothetical protein